MSHIICEICRHKTTPAYQSTVFLWNIAPRFTCLYLYQQTSEAVKGWVQNH